MNHPTKNMILAFYDNELDLPEAEKIRRHIQSCDFCQQYFSLLQNVDQILLSLPEQEPAADSLKTILQRIEKQNARPVLDTRAVSTKVILKFIGAIISILGSIYFIQTKMLPLSIWEKLSQFWIIKTVGSFGFLVMLFFLLSTFFTLSITPIFIFQHEKHFSKSR